MRMPPTGRCARLVLGRGPWAMRAQYVELLWACGARSWAYEGKRPSHTRRSALAKYGRRCA